MRNKEFPDFGRSLKELREKKGLSQEAVAEAARIGRSTLVHVESGADARLSKIAAVAKVLGASIEAVSEPRSLLLRKQARLEQAIRTQSVQVAHVRIAARLLQEDAASVEALREAREMVELWERDQTCSAFYINSWKSLLNGTPGEVGKALSSIDERWEGALLQNTPFGSFVGQHA